MSNTVWIGYPYVYPQDTDLPIDYNLEAHCTLMFLGESGTIGVTLDELRNYLSGLSFEDTGIVDVDGLALFGVDSDVLVMKLKSSALIDNFEMVRDRLAKVGVENASSFPDYSPHITLTENYHGPTIGYTLPTTVGLGKPQLWWGEEVFDLD